MRHSRHPIAPSVASRARRRAPIVIPFARARVAPIASRSSSRARTTRDRGAALRACARLVETASVVRAVSEENAARAAIVGDRAEACADGRRASEGWDRSAWGPF